MEELNKYTPTELLKMINDTELKHTKLKQEIVDLSFEIEQIEKKINEKIKTLVVYEKEYISLIEEMDNKK